MNSQYTILGTYRDPRSSNASVCVDVRSSEHDEIRFALTMAELDSDRDLRTKLLNSGYSLPDDKTAKVNFYREFREEVKRSPAIEINLNTGWDKAKKRFVGVDRTFGPNAHHVMHVSSIASAVNPPKIRMSAVKAWKSEVGKITDHSFLAIFAISIPFTGPIIGRGKASVEIPIFNFFGGSSTGKSFLLKVATTVFGNDDPDGSLVNWEFTGAGMEETLGERNHLFLAVDEEGLNADEIVKARRTMSMKWTGGRSKTRSKRYEGKRFCAFRVPVALSGNTTSDQLEATQEDRPLAVRWLDIPASATEAGDVFAEAFTLKKSVEDRSKLLKNVLAVTLDHQRHVGLQYLKHIARPASGAAFISHQEKAFRKFMAKHAIGVGRQQVRILEKFALVYSVAATLPSVGLVPWSRKRGEAAVEAIFARYKKKNPKGFRDEYEILIHLTHLIGNKELFPRIKLVDDIDEFNGIGMNVLSGDKKLACISRKSPSVQKQLFSHLKITLNELESLLRRHGLLFLNPQGKATLSRTLNGSGSKRHRFLPIDFEKLQSWLKNSKPRAQ